MNRWAAAGLAAAGMAMAWFLISPWLVGAVAAITVVAIIANGQPGKK